MVSGGANGLALGCYRRQLEHRRRPARRKEKLPKLAHTHFLANFALLHK